MISNDADDLCSLFDGTHEAVTLTFVSVYVRAHRSGVFAVAGDGAEAEVSLVRSVAGRSVSRVGAVAGTVTLELSAEQRSRFDIDVAIPEHPARELECNGVAAIDGSVEESCECERDDDERFQCIRSEANKSCCGQESGTTKPLRLSVESVYCPGLRSEVAGLGRCVR